ncbi:MAG: hypothetical protein ACTHMO_00080 [Rhodanobacteraceae bacterium]
MMDAEALKARIRIAFSDVEPPPHWCLVSSHEGTEPALLEKEFSAVLDRRWEELDPAFLDQAPGGFGSGFRFFPTRRSGSTCRLICSPRSTGSSSKRIPSHTSFAIWRKAANGRSTRAVTAHARHAIMRFTAFPFSRLHRRQRSAHSWSGLREARTACLSSEPTSPRRSRPIGHRGQLDVLPCRCCPRRNAAWLAAHVHLQGMEIVR